MDEPDLCPICLDNMLDRNGVVKTKCGHSFHMECVFGKNLQKCPMCRKDLRFKGIKYKPGIWDLFTGFFSCYSEDSLQVAAKDGDLETVDELLLRPGVFPQLGSNYALRKAAKNGHAEIVKALLEDFRCDPSAKDNYALRYAVKNNDKEVVRILVQDPRIRVDMNGGELIFHSIAKCSLDIIKLLMSHNSFRAPRYFRLLFFREAVFRYDPEIIKYVFWKLNIQKYERVGFRSKLMTDKDTLLIQNAIRNLV